MSICVIWASPNTDGLTAAAKDSLLAGIEKAGAQAEVIHLNALRLERCRACGDGWGKCREAGRCVLPDDFEMLYRKLEAAQGMVWVTPVYWHDMAESLKTFVDRLRRCETGHNHHLRGRLNLLVACAGGSGLGAIQCLHAMEEALSHMDMPVVDRLPVVQFNKRYMLPALAHAGETFAGYIYDGGDQP